MWEAEFTGSFFSPRIADANLDQRALNLVVMPAGLNWQLTRRLVPLSRSLEKLRDKIGYFPDCGLFIPVFGRFLFFIDLKNNDVWPKKKRIMSC